MKWVYLVGIPLTNMMFCFGLNFHPVNIFMGNLIMGILWCAFGPSDA